MTTNDYEDTFKNILDHMTDNHKHVLPVRLDFTFPEDYRHDGKNKEIAQLHKDVVQHYRNHNIEARYQTVREQEGSDHPHYHTMLLLDGNRIRSPLPVQQTTNNIWKRIVHSEKDGLVHFSKHQPTHDTPPLTMITRPSPKASDEMRNKQTAKFEKARCIAKRHAEYLHKPQGKGKAPDGVREMFASQIRRKKP